MENLAAKRTHNNGKKLILLCAVGLLLNCIGKYICGLLSLPLYLDTIGSALAAGLGGYIPGILTSLLSSAIWSISDINSIYYSSVMLLIAVASAFYMQKGYYSRLSRLPVIIVSFALIGGGLGSLLAWMLSGFTFETGITAPLAHRIYDMGHLSPFLSQLLADLLIDLADKTITVLIVALILRTIPESARRKFFFSHMNQMPPSPQTQAKMNKMGSCRRSLRRRFILLVSAYTLLSAVTVTGISFVYFQNVLVREEIQMANGIVHVISESFDHDRVNAFLDEGRDSEGYLEAEAIIRNLMESTDEITYCYVYRVLPDHYCVIFDPDVSDGIVMKPGDELPLEDALYEHLDQLLAGQPIDPIITNDEYGWLMSIYLPVYDSEGVCQCYACVDIDMNHIASGTAQFLAQISSLFFGFFIVILIFAIWLAEYNIIYPINAMAATSGAFAFDTEAARAGAVESMKRLDIRTGDEIENLYHSMVKTTEDMAHFIADVERQNETIGKLQNGLIMVLADMVESRDQCTGDHVRKTAAYTRIIVNELKKEGVYLDQLTDDFMDDVENSAPLHDVGKIHVPDAILNKPGKLTDEEFEVMKQHTTAGSEIIARAMSMVSEADSSYLREAQNLAYYHHEKWNGAGYPCGLSGEDIPLSARIMAVADVFDALVSRRSYKEGFSFEKAMDIIREGSGSHFDPNVASAFLRASDEVRQVMNTYLDE